jgi:hypothetical protein
MWRSTRRQQRKAGLRSRTSEGRRLQGDNGFWYLAPEAENGEIVADSAERLPAQGCAITMAQTVNLAAELVIDDKSKG